MKRDELLRKFADGQIIIQNEHFGYKTTENNTTPCCVPDGYYTFINCNSGYLWYSCTCQSKLTRSRKKFLRSRARFYSLLKVYIKFSKSCARGTQLNVFKKYLASAMAAAAKIWCSHMRQSAMKQNLKASFSDNLAFNTHSKSTK